MSGRDQINPAVWKITSVAMIGSFMAQLDATVVNVSLSSLSATFHRSVSGLQWVTSGYLLALALVLPLSGWLVDRIGTRALYLWCFASFTLSSMLCGVASSADALIGFRILQGVSGGLLAPMAQMLVAREAGQQMARVMGIAALPVLLAPLLGPVIAGTILRFASWRWLFFINLPIGALALVLAACFLPADDRRATRRGLDVAGLAVLSPGLVLLLYGCDHLREPSGAPALAASLILIAWFVRGAARKGGAALIDLRLLKKPVFQTAIVTMFLLNGVSFAGQMLIPVYLSGVGGRSPISAGLLLAPLGLGMICTFPLMGVLTQRFGIRDLAAGGALLALAGSLPLLALAGHGLATGLLVAALFIRGAGMSAIGVPSITAAYASVQRQDLPMATTAMNIVQRLGGPTLTTLCATLLGWRLAASVGPHLGPNHTSGAFTAAFLMLCALHALLVLAAARLPRIAQRPVNSPAPAIASADRR